MNTWDLLLRRGMMAKVNPTHPHENTPVNVQEENFSSPLVQAVKALGKSPKTSKGANGLLMGAIGPGMSVKSR